MQRIRRRLVAPTSGGDIERVKRIKANDGQLLAVGNQSGASLGVAAADFRIASNGVSLDNQTALLAAGGTTSVRTVLNSLQSQVANAVANGSIPVGVLVARIEEHETLVNTSLSTFQNTVTQTYDEVADALNGIELDVGDVQTGLSGLTTTVTNLTGRVDANEAAVDGFDDLVGEVESDLLLVASSINGLTTRADGVDVTLTEVQSDATTLKARVAAAETSLTSTTTSLSTVTGNLSALTGRVTTAEGELDTVKDNAVQLSAVVTGEQTNLALLTTRVGSTETSIGTQATNLVTIGSQVSALVTKNTEQDGAIDLVKTRVSSLETRVDVLDGKSVTVANAIAALTTTQSTAATSASALSTRVDALETTVDNQGTNLVATGTSLTTLTGRVNSVETQLLYVPRAIKNGFAGATMLTSEPGSASGGAGEKSQVLATVSLVAGRSYQLNFGYNGLRNNYTALPGGAVTSAPHPSPTGAMCRNFYILCRVHRGTIYNNLGNLYLALGATRVGGSFNDANASFTGVFRASPTAPVYPGSSTVESTANENVYSLVMYVKNNTWSGGTGNDAAASLIFDSAWFRLEEQPDAPAS